MGIKSYLIGLLLMTSTSVMAENVFITNSSNSPVPVLIVGSGGGGVVSPTVTLSSNPPGATKEIGVVLSSTFTATTVEGTNPITTFTIKRNGVVVFTDLSPSPTGGSETYNDPAISSTGAYVATVGDGTNTGNSNTITFTFVYPFYYGVGDQGLTCAQVQGLTKLVQTKQNTTTTTSPSTQVYYFAYLAAYGSLTSILDESGFQTIAGYTKHTYNCTMLDSSSQSYYVYEFNTLTTQTNFSNTYKF